jgi:hypothetical protein
MLTKEARVQSQGPERFGCTEVVSDNTDCYEIVDSGSF